MTNTRPFHPQEASFLPSTDEAHSTDLENDIENMILDAVSNRCQASFLLHLIKPIIESFPQKNKIYLMIYAILTTPNINTINISELQECIKHISSQYQEEQNFDRKIKLKNLSQSLNITRCAIEYKYCENTNTLHAKQELESAIQKEGNFIFFNLSGAYLENLRLTDFDFSGLYLTGANLKGSYFIHCPNYLMVLMSDDKKNVEEKIFMPFQDSILLERYLNPRIINSMIFLFFASIKQNFESVDQEFDQLINIFRFKIEKNPCFSLTAMLSLYQGLFPSDEFPIDDSRLEYFKYVNHFFNCLSATFIQKKNVEHVPSEEIMAFYQTKMIDLNKSTKETLESDSQFNIDCAQHALNYAMTQFENTQNLRNLLNIFKIMTTFNLMPPSFIALLNESKHYELLKQGIEAFDKAKTQLSEKSQEIIDDIYNRIIQLDDANTDWVNTESYPIENNISQNTNTQDTNISDRNKNISTEKASTPRVQYVESDESDEFYESDELEVIVIPLKNQESSNETLPLLEQIPTHEPAYINTQKNSSRLATDDVVQDSSVDLASITPEQTIKIIFSITEDLQNPFLEKLTSRMLGSSEQPSLVENVDEYAPIKILNYKSLLLDEIENKFCYESDLTGNRQLNLVILIHLAQIILTEYAYQSITMAEKELHAQTTLEPALSNSDFEIGFKNKINHYLLGLLALIQKNIKLNTQEIATAKMINMTAIAYRIIMNFSYRIKEKKIESDSTILKNADMALDKIMKYLILPLRENSKTLEEKFLLQQAFLGDWVLTERNNKNTASSIHAVFDDLNKILQNNQYMANSNRVHLWFAWSGLIKIGSVLLDKINNSPNRLNDHKQNTQKKAKRQNINTSSQSREGTQSLPVSHLKSLLSSIQAILDKAKKSLALINDISKAESILIKSPLPTPLFFLKTCLPLLPNLDDFRGKNRSDMDDNELNAWDDFIINLQKFYNDLKDVLIFFNSHSNWFMECNHPIQFFKEFLSQKIEPGLKAILEEREAVSSAKIKFKKNESNKADKATIAYQALILESENKEKLLKEKKKEKEKKNAEKNKEKMLKEKAKLQKELSKNHNEDLSNSTSSKISPDKNKNPIDIEARSKLQTLLSLDREITRDAQTLLEKVDQVLRLPLSTREKNNNEIFESQIKEINEKYKSFKKKCHAYQIEHQSAEGSLFSKDQMALSLSLLEGLITPLSEKITLLSKEIATTFHTPTQTNHYVSAYLNATSKPETPTTVSTTKNKNPANPVHTNEPSTLALTKFSLFEALSLPKEKIIVVLVPTACSFNEIQKEPNNIILFREQSNIMAARGESKIILTQSRLDTLRKILKEVDFSFDKSQELNIIEGKYADLIEEIIDSESKMLSENSNQKSYKAVVTNSSS